MADAPLPGDHSHLSQILTHWSGIVKQSDREVSRYYRAAYCFFLHQVGAPDTAEELTSRFCERFLQGEFSKNYDPAKAQYRLYLKTCLRNMVRDHFRHQQKDHGRFQPLPSEVSSPDEQGAADDTFDSALHEELIERAWQSLQALEERTRTPYLTVLKHKTLHPDLGGSELAEKINQSLQPRGISISEENVRQILKRARDSFADALVSEVEKMLPPAEHHRLEEELIDLKLLPYAKLALSRRQKKQA